MLPENLTRTCWDCKQEKPLTLEYFTKCSNPRFKYGMAYQCKECKHRDSLQPHRVETKRIKQREYQRRIRATPEGRQKIKARKSLNGYLKRGKIIRPSCCDRCQGNHGRLEAHHHNGYSREYWLDVEWLCKRCHKS